MENSSTTHSIIILDETTRNTNFTKNNKTLKFNHEKFTFKEGELCVLNDDYILRYKFILDKPPEEEESTIYNYSRFSGRQEDPSNPNSPFHFMVLFFRNKDINNVHFFAWEYGLRHEIMAGHLNNSDAKKNNLIPDVNYLTQYIAKTGPLGDPEDTNKGLLFSGVRALDDRSGRLQLKTNNSAKEIEKFRTIFNKYGFNFFKYNLIEPFI